MIEVSPVTRRELSEWRKELKAINKEWPKQATKVNQVVARKAAGYARSKASAAGKLQARSAGAIKGTGAATGARITIRAGARTPFALAAFWGAKKHTGWYAAPKYARSGRPNLPTWVGNTWEVGIAGQGPYAINDAIAGYGDELMADWRAGIDELTARAFPN